MSSVSYITARDLFLSHHWTRYPAFDLEVFAGYRCGRIIEKNTGTVTLQSSDSENSKIKCIPRGWSSNGLREPQAAESAPPVDEVLLVGDWIGVRPNGDTVLFAPCLSSGVTAVQDGALLVRRMRQWRDFLETIRSFFRERNFLEMTTPTITTSPGTEPFLDPLSVTIETDGLLTEKFLITSPEFHLKKTLAAGATRIFEIAKCFRDREGGPHHRVEFHMLEWYRTFSSLKEIAEDVEALFNAVLLQGTSAPPREKLFSLKKVSVVELFREFVDFDLRSTTTREDLLLVSHRFDVRVVESDSFNDLFNKIFLEKIEGRLEEYGNGGPVLISGYPPSMAALARIGADGFADRFEVYWRGLEICNAFHELNDPSENRQRFEHDTIEKNELGKSAVPIDDELMRAFEAGVPPAGGIALGLERLFMAVHNFNNMAEVRPFLSRGT